MGSSASRNRPFYPFSVKAVTEGKVGVERQEFIRPRKPSFPDADAATPSSTYALPGMFDIVMS